MRVLLISISIILCAATCFSQGSKIYRTQLKYPSARLTAEQTPPDTAYYVILAGQSNSIGRADTAQMPAYYKFLRDTVQGYIFNNSSFEKMRAGINSQGNAGQFGLETSLADTIFKNLGKKYYIIKYGVGGTSICADAAQYWLPSASNNLFANLKNTITSAKNWFVSNGKVGVPLAVVWVQGENDAVTAVCANAYQANLEGVIDSLRNFMSMPSLPFIVGLNAGDGDGLQVYRETVRTAQKNVVKTEYTSYAAGFSPSTTGYTRDNTFLITTLDYSVFDGVHYNGASTIQFGHDVFKILKGQNILK